VNGPSTSPISRKCEIGGLHTRTNHRLSKCTLPRTRILLFCNNHRSTTTLPPYSHCSCRHHHTGSPAATRTVPPRSRRRGPSHRHRAARHCACARTLMCFLTHRALRTQYRHRSARDAMATQLTTTPTAPRRCRTKCASTSAARARRRSAPDRAIRWQARSMMMWLSLLLMQCSYLMSSSRFHWKCQQSSEYTSRHWPHRKLLPATN
jgi:hypothetical protein